MLFPVLLLMIFAAIQTALFFHAQHIALVAAQQGLAAGSAQGAGIDVAERVASEFAASSSGDDVLLGRNVEVHGDGPLLSVTVTGQPLQILPAIPVPVVSQTVTGPLEPAA